MSGMVPQQGHGLPSPDLGHSFSANGFERDSWLLTYLPGIFDEEDSSFLARYLMIFGTIFDQFERMLDTLPHYFTADTAPDAFLPWLASWVGLILEDGWPEERKRALLASAIELHRRRGTVRGIVEHVFLYTGVRPSVLERGSGLVLGKASRLGYQTMLGRGDDHNTFAVVLRVPDPQRIDRAQLRTIVEAQRPAHTSFAIFVLPESNGGQPGESVEDATIDSAPPAADDETGVVREAQ
jgi:phage tail-like protein